MNSMVQWTNVTSDNGYLGSADCHVQLSTNIHTIPRCHAHIRQRENEEALRKKQSSIKPNTQGYIRYTVQVHVAVMFRNALHH